MRKSVVLRKDIGVKHSFVKIDKNLKSRFLSNILKLFKIIS